MKTIFVYLCRLILFPAAHCFTVRTEGTENIPKKGGFILASNHINGLDYWFIGKTFNKHLRKLKFVGARDTIKTAIMSAPLYYLSEPVIINRKEGDRASVLKKIEKHIKQEEIVVIFPEGDTNSKKELLRGKSGIAELALDTQASVLPMGLRKIEGSPKRIVAVGKPMIFEEERKQALGIKKGGQQYYNLLRKTTDNIMQEISILSGKPYLYGN